MEPRVKKLENLFSDLATDVAVIKSNHATKQDLAEVRSEVREIKADIASIKQNYATKADVLAIRGDLYQAITSQTKWMVSMQLITMGLALTVAKAIF